MCAAPTTPAVGVVGVEVVRRESLGHSRFGLTECGVKQELPVGVDEDGRHRRDTIPDYVLQLRMDLHSFKGVWLGA